MGAFIMLFPRARVTTLIPALFFFFTIRIPAVLMLGYWFFIQFLSGVASLGAANQGGVAWWAHIGGFAAGLVLTPFLKSSHVPFFGPRSLRGPWG